jgi:predicted transcriptional regulator
VIGVAVPQPIAILGTFRPRRLRVGKFVTRLRIRVYASARICAMGTVVSTRLPGDLVGALDAAAAERQATRSALLRAIVEDAIDANELPDVAPTPQDELDREDARLRALTT